MNEEQKKAHGEIKRAVAAVDPKKGIGPFLSMVSLAAYAEAKLAMEIILEMPGMPEESDYDGIVASFDVWPSWLLENEIVRFIRDYARRRFFTEPMKESFELFRKISSQKEQTAVPVIE